MKLVWSPKIALKAYIETVKQCQQVLHENSGVAELISAMAAGWNAQLIVETWSSSSEEGVIGTSLGLAIAREHTGGRHVCIVPNQRSKLKYEETSTEIIVTEEEGVMEGWLVGIDFMVVDSKRREFSRLVKAAKFSAKGAVLVSKNAAGSGFAQDFKWRNVVEEEGSCRIVRSVFLPVSKGLDIAHVSAARDNNKQTSQQGRKKWFKHVDHQSGEMHVIRR